MSNRTQKHAPSSTEIAKTTALRADLARRLRSPQRHRLLHGYPMAPLVPDLRGFPNLDMIEKSTERPLLVGVLPHASCNPKVRGCGFCTFPHEKFDRTRVEDVIAAVALEVRSQLELNPALRTREIDGVYFGGGTANLS